MLKLYGKQQSRRLEKDAETLNRYCLSCEAGSHLETKTYNDMTYYEKLWNHVLNAFSLWFLEKKVGTGKTSWILTTGWFVNGVFLNSALVLCSCWPEQDERHPWTTLFSCELKHPSLRSCPLAAPNHWNCNETYNPQRQACLFSPLWTSCSNFEPTGWIWKWVVLFLPAKTGQNEPHWSPVSSYHVAVTILPVLSCSARQAVLSEISKQMSALGSSQSWPSLPKEKLSRTCLKWKSSCHQISTGGSVEAMRHG